MTKETRNKCSIELIAEYIPEPSTNEKSYRLIRLTLDNGKEREILMDSDCLTNLEELERFFIRKGHYAAANRSYWKAVRLSLSQPVDVQLHLRRVPGYFRESYLCVDGTILGRQDEWIRLHPEAKFRHTAEEKVGKLKAWRKEVASLAIYSDRLMLGLCTSLTGLILNWTKVEGGGSHLSGLSAAGKTTALIHAASVYGGEEYLNSWCATEAGIEEMACERNHAFLPLDDLKELDSSPTRAAQIVGKVVYLLSNGRGKVRSVNYQSGSSRFRTSVLSTGERSLREHALIGGEEQLDGERVRMIDVPADAKTGFGIFNSLPNGFSNAAKFADYIRATCELHHGVAKPAFVQSLLKYESKHPGKLELLIDVAIDSFIKSSDIDIDDGVQVRFTKRFGLLYGKAPVF